MNPLTFEDKASNNYRMNSKGSTQHVESCCIFMEWSFLRQNHKCYFTASTQHRLEYLKGPLAELSQKSAQV